MMGAKLRFRCPTCGWLSWQKRLNEDHPFEIFAQTSEGRGRIKYIRARESDQAVRVFKGLLAVKMAQRARRLAESVDAPVRITVEFLDEVEATDEQATFADDFEVVTTPAYESQADLVPGEQEYTAMSLDEGEYEVEMLTEDHVQRRWLPRFARRRHTDRHMREIVIRPENVMEVHSDG